MENASKALLMAGGVLISIIIISMLLLVSNSLTSYKQTSVQTKREAQIYEFNQQYEGYKRNGIRGNELYSLISKVIDYNQRKSTIGKNDEKFEPMQISFNLKGKNKDLTKDNENRIFKSEYEKDGKFVFDTSSYSDSLRKKTTDVINTLTSEPVEGSNNTELLDKGVVFKFTESSLDRLVTGYEKIFIQNDEYYARSVNDKMQVFLNFNNAFGANFFVIPKITIGAKKGQIDETKLDNLWKLIDNNGDEIRKSVNTYYEYVQFKRAIFNYIEDSAKYSSTGRIIKIEFEFTGKFN